VDMDLRKPKIHRAFNISNSVGLSQMITKNVKKEHAVYKHTDYLHILPAGEKMPFPAEFLLSKSLTTLIEDLKNDYEKIIIDCPPMAAVADASIISRFSDGTIVVVASRSTKKPLVDEMIKTLKLNGANIVGGILTRVKQNDYRYQTGYYYYGE
ncbi:MAG: CpsD/CapB family tyrosine-protein kinase, partial [Candidatus Izemoplasmataceae bacterium]